MTFHSILFARTEDSIHKETLEAPAFFVDLNLDQIIDTITADKQEYNLKPFFYTPLKDIDAITYRHEIMRDLEDHLLFEYIQSFTQKMHAMREYLTQVDKLYYTYQKERWFVDAVELYCDAVTGLEHDLSLVNVQSRGFLTFREYVTDYAHSGRFTSLRAETKKMMQCGMFVPAESFCANVCEGLFTHYKRKEDATMTSGKLDEELSRMSGIVDRITSNAMVLLNESFAATNEREGSEIARQIICAFVEKRIQVFFVTHLYEFAHGFYNKHMENAMFLRAERQADGRRTFKLLEGEPLQTSFGKDVYHRIFATDK